MGTLKRGLDWAFGVGQLVQEALDPEATLLEIGRSVQLDDYSCGAQAAFMILRYFARARCPAAVARALGTNEEDGTDVAAFRLLFQQRQLRTIIKTRARVRQLADAIDAGAPVLVSLDDEEHWGVVYGYSPQRIYLADPSIRRWRVGVPKPAFKRRWDGWAMIVAP